MFRIVLVLPLMQWAVCGMASTQIATPFAAEHEHFAPIRLSRLFFEYDQDGNHANWIADGPDHAYTGGLQAFVSFQGSRIDDVCQAVLWDLDSAEYAFGVGAKFRVFTPDNVTRVWHPGPEERPYAGWLTSSFAFQQKTDGIEDHLGIELGVVGPSSRAWRVQQRIHPALGWQYTA